MAISKNKLVEIFKKNLKIKGNFDENLKIYSSSKWDSLANFNILLQIEKDFNVHILSLPIYFRK